MSYNVAVELERAKLRISRGGFVKCLLRLAFTTFLTGTMSTSAMAVLVYEFVNDPPIAVRATLELTRVPAGIGDIVELTFTPEGDVFGLGPSVTGPFSFTTFESIAETTPGHLGCTGCAPSTGHLQSFIYKELVGITDELGRPVSFVMRFENVPGGDAFGFANPSPPMTRSRMFNGDWIRVVPEPTSFKYGLLLLFVVMGAKCRTLCV